MKKRIMMVMTVAVLVIAALALVACGGNAMTVKAVDAQITALTEVKSGTADAAIIDSTMAGYLINKEGSDYADLAMIPVEGTNFEKEYYGVAAKKGKTKLIGFINQGLKAAKESGKYAEIAGNYGLTSRTNGITFEGATVAEDWKSELNDPTKVVIGYTINAPMGIKDGDTVTGFDIDLAREIFGDKVAIECKQINWDSKTADLNAGKIDLVWNGLTINEERLETMEISSEYLINEQAVVVKAANKDTIKAVADFAGKKVAVENGSAGQDAAAVIESTVNAK